VPDSTSVKGISPEEAWDLVQKNPRALLIDVRSNMEYLFVGHPSGAIHVPWIDEPEWNINPHFVQQIRQLLLGGCVEPMAAPIVRQLSLYAEAEALSGGGQTPGNQWIWRSL